MRGFTKEQVWDAYQAARDLYAPKTSNWQGSWVGRYEGGWWDYSFERDILDPINNKLIIGPDELENIFRKVGCDGGPKIAKYVFEKLFLQSQVPANPVVNVVVSPPKHVYMKHSGVKVKEYSLDNGVVTFSLENGSEGTCTLEEFTASTIEKEVK